ncbi:TraR/DksA C4-type zinc finger protein [Ramlibacter ginsenosidimutans]|uniref:TraR/DksA C4-type zinc finger protein n=1 Tax=Ramlibacter ginsenosidimutans TaxID=502333 RepID=A0A934WMF9_9BURK|nr:TraR/DksA family transcriptional regulator [Ramlibacter ginsenosidimutans]MBK6007759.1 TraR/DksA C4-type zinc finger protein [Ramlibacter ginsenosidimutans]
MKPIAPSPDLTSQLAAQLRERRQELQSLLHAAAEAAKAGDAPADVVDFKDVAAIDSRAQVDEVAQTHAIEELERIAAALRRVDAGTYGQCADCGEAIDERRLRALPATPFCTACQAIHERPALGRR